MALIVSPMVVPLVIVAVGVYFAYAPFGLTEQPPRPDARPHARSPRRSW